MTRRKQLEALAARVEALTGPCRETDAEIAAALRVGTVFSAWAENYSAWRGCSDGRVYLGSGGPSFTAPAYTDSLDDAMTLVPEGWLTLEVRQDHDGAEWYWTIYPAYLSSHKVQGRGRKAEHALTAASLRAIAAQEPTA